MVVFKLMTMVSSFWGVTRRRRRRPFRRTRLGEGGGFSEEKGDNDHVVRLLAALLVDSVRW